MRLKCLIVVCSLLAILVTTVARADTYTVKLTGEWPVMYTDSVEPYAWLETGNRAYVSPVKLQVQDVESGLLEEILIGFCGDRKNVVSDTFYVPPGQEYYRTPLGNDPVYSEDQAELIQSLFDHTYSFAFDENGDLVDLTVVQAIQLTLWYVTTNGAYPATVLAPDPDSRSLAQIFIDALNAENWSGVFWESYDFSEEIKTDILVFYTFPTSDSQTMISVSYSKGGGYNITPEPATLAIFGLGFFGVGFTARRRS